MLIEFGGCAVRLSDSLNRICFLRPSACLSFHAPSQSSTAVLFSLTLVVLLSGTVTNHSVNNEGREH
jgi:hypothetical protein